MREILTSCSTEEGLAQRESDQEANLGEEVNPTAVPYTGTRASPANIRAPTGSLVPAPGGVSISENDRYARHALIPGWQQQSLREARVVVVGMGAVGNEVTRVLAMAGVGAFVVCDPDRIETSNLSRTVLFRDNDIGRLKVEAAADALRRLVPGIEVDARPLPLVHGVGLAELRDASLVLACLDSRSARLQLAGRYPARREGGSETLGPCNEPVVAEWNFCPHCGQPNG
ncbi:MAG: ThiF family adenylyltransferase [bacterium]|nr:ThiF family adenylyltransferase [bacterium]